MITTDQLTPEIEMKARQYVNLGYQRLLTFESPGGGFDWYGREPGKPILTAYGLMEFADMEKVHYVDPAMIKRTQQWLAGKQKSNGSWPPDDHDLFNVLNTTLQSTAYATWALVHSGYSLSDYHIINGKKFIKTQVDETEDNYTLALCANALLEKNPTDLAGLAILDRLEAKKVVDGDTVYWTSGGQSFTYSKGNYLDLETTAMITLAMMTANWRYPQTIEDAINYIIRKKEAFGLWGQTQATVLSLRVLMKALAGQTEETNSEIFITINGVTLDKADLPILKVNPIDTKVLRLIELQPYTLEGDNFVGISLIGDGNLLYQIVGTYYLPWQEVILPSLPPLSIDLQYDRTTLTVDDTILCTVTVTNNIPDSVTRIGMIDLGIPPGFQVFWEDFQKAVEEEKIFKYESTNRQLSLYLHPLSYGDPLSMTYRLQAKYPLKVSTPKSTAYSYYTPNEKDETKPVTITVTP
jgi:uncharacterized repeat protein (TIGR01451 family)